MRSVHQDFGLDYWHEALLVAQRSVLRQALRVGFNALLRRQAFCGVNRYHCAPFRELRSLGLEACKPFTQAVQSLSYLFALETRQVLRALVDFYAGSDSPLLQCLRERDAVRGLLAERFLVQYRAAYVRFYAGSGDE